MKSILLRTCGLTAIAIALTPSAHAANFTISGSSTTAQTLSASQTGTITSTGSLTVGGSGVAVTITGNGATFTNLGSLDQTSEGRAIRDNTGVTGLTVTNGSATNSAATIVTNDADVIQMNKSPASVILNNYGQMTSTNTSAGGNQVVDFNAIASGSNVVNNYATGVMRAYEADAVRPGVNGVVNNYGQIISSTATGSSSDGVDAQNNSGVSITNYTGGLIEGGRHGITGGAINNTVTFTMSVTNQIGATIQGDNGSGINIDGFNAKELVTVVNGGTITGNGHDIGDGAAHDGDGVDVDGLVNLTNTGTIRSINAYSPTASGVAFSEGMSVGGGMITNSGTIEGSVAAGNTNAVGRGITLTGNDITSGPFAGGRDPIYGDATVINQAGGLIKGDTDAGIAVVGAYASGNKVAIENDAGATIQGGGSKSAAIEAASSFDNVSITNAGTINGSSSGKAIELGSGANTVTITGGAAKVLGDISGGVGGTNQLNLDMGKGNSFAYNGAISNFADTEIKSGVAKLSGSVAGPATVDAGAGLQTGDSGVATLSVGNLTFEKGGQLLVDLDSADSLNGLLKVNGDVALNGADLELTLLSAPTTGEKFDILVNDGSDAISGKFAGGDWVYADFGNHVYAFHVDYDFNADGGLVGNDIALTAAPEPATWLLMGIGGVALMGVAARRRGLALV